jgi:hypothetical protein
MNYTTTITNKTTGEIHVINDFATLPAWAREQMDIHDEVQFSRSMENYNLFDYYTDDGAHTGSDCDGVSLRATPYAEAMIPIIAANDSGEFLTGGDNIVAVAAQWAWAGLTPAQAAAYIAARCFDPSRVAQLIAAGVSPERAAVRGEDGETYGCSFCNGDIAIDEIP